MNQPVLLFALIILSYIQCETPRESVDNQIVINLEEHPDTVQIFGKDLISTNLSERDITVSPDGNEIIYTLQNHKQTVRALVSLKKEGGNWLKAKILPFSGTHADIEPFFSPDGEKLFFASNRPLASGSKRKDYNIWSVNKSETGWETPTPLPSSINSEKDEFYPAVANSGNLYFTAAYEGGVGSEDIWMSEFSEGKFSSPIPLDTSVNSKTYEFNAYISPKEDLIIFSSYGRPDDLGGGDLYFSTKNDSGNWSEAIHFKAPVNSPKLDYCPFVDFTNSNLYFTSNRVSEIPDKFSEINQIREYSKRILNGYDNIYRIGLHQTGIY